jgi:GT2 family glycosyltransferase
MKPRLTVLIATYNRYGMLPNAIASLRAQTLAPGRIEIIVVDNSPDHAQAKAFAQQVSVVPNLTYVLEPRPGISNARNAGIALARADIVACLDDDAVADPGWAEAILLGFADYGPRAGILGGKVRPLWRAKRPDWLGDELLGHLSVIDNGPNLRALRADERINGCNMAFDRALVQDLGGFATTLGRRGPDLTLLSNEEPELFARIRAAGRDIIYAPNAVVDHDIDPARLDQSWFRRRAAWQAVSDYLLDPKAMSAAAPAAARYLRLVETSGARARPVGFFAHAGGPGQFAAELRLIRQLTIATLHGGAEMPSHAARDTQFFARLLATAMLNGQDALRKSPAAVALARLWRRRAPPPGIGAER